jgi:predicted nucleotidyltransferase
MDTDTKMRSEVTRRLTDHWQELARFGVKSLALFGSVARDEAQPASDVDLLVEFNGRATFDQYMDLKLYLEELLGCRVDLVTRKALRPQLRPIIEREALYVTRPSAVFG